MLLAFISFSYGHGVLGTAEGIIQSEYPIGFTPPNLGGDTGSTKLSQLRQVVLGCCESAPSLRNRFCWHSGFLPCVTRIQGFFHCSNTDDLCLWLHLQSLHMHKTHQNQFRLGLTSPYRGFIDSSLQASSTEHRCTSSSPLYMSSLNTNRIHNTLLAL